MFQGKFVAAFSQANEGDVSPNTQGAKCIDTGIACDFNRSTCDGKVSIGKPEPNKMSAILGLGFDDILIFDSSFHKTFNLFNLIVESVPGNNQY